MMKFAAAVLTLSIAGVATAQETILGAVAASEIHTTLEAAVLAAPAAITDLLSNPDVNLTLFGPDDAAFNTLPAGTVDSLVSPPWQPHLACVLQGHVYPEAAVPSSAITGPLTVDSAEPGYELNLDFVDGDVMINDVLVDGTVTVNGIAVTVPDIPASNGVIHSISAGVLLPPCVTKNIMDVLAADDDFTTLVSLITTAGLVDALSGAPTADGLTVMSPNNNAFGDVPVFILDYLAGNVTALTEVLTYHVIGSNVIPTESVSAATLQGDSIEVVVDGDDITLNDNSMVKDTVLASNGVIHEISAVLLPPSLVLPEAPTTEPPTTEPPTSGAASSGSLFAALAVGVISFLYL